MAKAIRGTISPEQFQGDLRQGDSPVMLMAKGTFVMGNVLTTDTDGNAIDSGASSLIVTVPFMINGVEVCRVIPPSGLRIRK